MGLFFAVICFILLFLAFLLNIFSLPGNWVVLGIMVVWFACTSWDGSTAFFVATCIAAGLGELLEFATQYLGAKRYGSSGRGSWGGFIGAIAGAIFGASFLLGFGALIGGLGGAYLGCLLAEFSKGRPIPEARRAAFGNFIGKFVGLSLKLACGIYVLRQSFGVLFPPQSF